MTVQLDLNPYPAAGDAWTLAGGFLKLPSTYNASVTAGKAWLNLYLGLMITVCPNTRIVLTGYSQGAQVAADVYEAASPATRSHILGIVLFGDPYFNSYDVLADADSLAPEGNYVPGTQGALAEVLDSGGRAIFPFDSDGHVFSFCHYGDPVCQGDPLSTFTKYLALYQFNHHNDYNQWGEPQYAANRLTDLEGGHVTRFFVCPSADASVIGTDPYTGVTVYQCNKDWSGSPFHASTVMCSANVVGAKGKNFSTAMYQGSTPLFQISPEIVGGTPWYTDIYVTRAFQPGSYACQLSLNGAPAAAKAFRLN